MRIEFADGRLERLYREASFTGGLEGPLVESFRDCLQLIVAAPTPEVLAAFRTLEPELDGRSCVVHVANNCRLLVQFDADDEGHMARLESLVIDKRGTS